MNKDVDLSKITDWNPDEWKTRKMPRHYDKLKSVLEELGIPFNEKISEMATRNINHGDRVIQIENTGLSDKVIGYRNFVAEFYFTVDGDFRKVGIWESWD